MVTSSVSVPVVNLQINTPFNYVSLQENAFVLVLEMSTTDFERLERLEQAITLCLQEIDHNFIRCHRVATACLPVVERYAEQSRSVWDGAKVPCPLHSKHILTRTCSSGNNSLKLLLKFQ